MVLLSRGSRGDEVARIQALLGLAHFSATPIDADFGSGTEQAVQACQANEAAGC